MTLRGQRMAIAFALGWDVRDPDLSPYQYGRHTIGRTVLYNAGDSYAVAVKTGRRVPPQIAKVFGPWEVIAVPGWDVYLSTQGEEP